jgi:4-amino-4-deoxy-L-arabinose transferase-like glycosyltransferase
MNEFAPPVRSSRKVLVLSLLGLAAFLAVQALLLRHFIRVDTRPPSWDQSTHLEIALDYREALGAGRWADAWFLAPKPGMPPFPPAYHLLLRGIFDSPDPAHAALWLNWFYMAVLALSLFGISWRFLPDSRALAATLAFCAAPGLQDLVTTQLVDLAMVAWVSAGYWALLECEGFTGWLPSLAFGVLYAVGMMHKWTYFSYMLPAYLIAGRSLTDRHARLKVLAAAVLSLALFAPWYWSHIALLPSRLAQASSDFAVPFWKEGAWAVYLKQACGGLGPLVWALGFLSMLAPQFSRRREGGGIVG